MVNLFSVTRDLSDPYAIYIVGRQRYHVVKTYKSPVSERNDPYARWLVAVIPQVSTATLQIQDMYKAELQRGHIVAATREWQENYHDCLSGKADVKVPAEYLAELTRQDEAAKTAYSPRENQRERFCTAIRELFVETVLPEAAQEFAKEVLLELDNAINLINTTIAQYQKKFEELGFIRKNLSALPYDIEQLNTMKRDLHSLCEKMQTRSFYKFIDNLNRPRVKFYGLRLRPSDRDINGNMQRSNNGADYYFAFLFHSKIQEQFAKRRCDQIEEMEYELLKQKIFPGKYALYYWATVLMNETSHYSDVGEFEFQLLFDFHEYPEDVNNDYEITNRVLNARFVPISVDNTYQEADFQRSRYFWLIAYLSGFLENLNACSSQVLKNPDDVYPFKRDLKSRGVAPRITIRKEDDSIIVEEQKNFLPGLARYGFRVLLPQQAFEVSEEIPWETIRRQLLHQYGQGPVNVETQNNLDFEVSGALSLLVEIHDDENNFIGDFYITFTYPFIKFVEVEEFEYALTQNKEFCITAGDVTKSGDLEVFFYNIIQRMLRTEWSWAVYPENVSLKPLDLSLKPRYLERHLQKMIMDI